MARKKLPKTAPAFAAVIRKELAARGWTVYVLAKTAGLGQTTTSRLVDGIGDPYLSSLTAVAGALGIPLRDLVDPVESEKS